MSFSIIIPSRTIDNLRPCVACIRNANPHGNSRVIIVDDFEPGELDQARASGPEALRSCTVVQGIKPFVFARNINLGIAAAGDDDVILLNDDACLATPFGFGYLQAIARDHPEIGILSAGITAAVGNEEQLAQPGTRLRLAKHHTLVFVCVYIRRPVLNALKYLDLSDFLSTPYQWWLDEHFVNYGYDDDDMCERVRQLGLRLGVFDGCVVEHGTLPSTYRGAASASLTDLRPNRERFAEKWGFAPGQGPSMKPKAAPVKF